MSTVSVGLPVYNGATYLETALRSLVSQSHRDLEIIISDNASSDETQRICEEFAAADPRIRYIRQPTNQGGAYNHTYVANLATGDYFRWFAADDVLAPTCIEECVKVLNADPEVVLAWPYPVVFDDHGSITEYAREPIWDDRSPSTRLASLLGPPDSESLLRTCYPIYGLARRDAFQACLPLGAYYASDNVVVVGLALRGRFHRVDGDLLFLRRHPQSSTYRKSRHEVAQWMSPSLTPGRSMPTLRRYAGFARAVRRAPVPLIEKTRCVAQVARWPLVRGHWRLMAWDVRVIGRELLEGGLTRSRRRGRSLHQTRSPAR